MPPTPSPQRPALLFVPCSQRTWCNRCCWGLGRPSLWVPGTRARERRVVRCGHQGTRVKTKRPEARRGGAGAGGVTGLTLHNQREGLGGERGGGRPGRREGGAPGLSSSGRPQAAEGQGRGTMPTPHPRPGPHPSHSPGALPAPAFPTAGRFQEQPPILSPRWEQGAGKSGRGLRPL